MRIYLTGYMGSGKSTYGKMLAEISAYMFYDLDTEIEKQCGLPIPQIFEIHGEEYFRRLEKEALHKSLHFTNAVISCGGGTPAFYDNMSFMLQHGITVFLKQDISILLNDLKEGMAHRPLLSKAENPERYIRESIRDRNVYYRQADIIINPSFFTPSLLWEYLKSRQHSKGQNK